ncbi:MAG: InlB B-repeat-containing protein, partial [Bacilli bacterium]
NLTIEIVDDTTVYAITGWDSDITFITSNKDVNAVYSTVDRYYTVSFYAEGVLIDAQTIEYGSAATAPTAPEKASTADYFYTFKYWDKDTTFITSDLDVNAIYEKTKLNYNVTFVDGDGNTIKVDLVKYQEEAKAPSTATKLPTASEMYIFTGWDKEFSSVTSDLVVTAQFSSYIRTFTVIFKDDIGNILKEETVEYGSSATAPTPPEKEATEYFTYTPEWDQNFNTITEDMVINLYYNAVERLFYATFYDYDGTIIQKVSGAYGTIISAPEASEKPMTNEYVYTFSSWNPEFSTTLVEDIEYNPVYDKSLRLYTVTFLDGNENEAEVQYVTYGATPTKPSITPVKDATNQYYYIFRMWETTSIKVYQDVTIRALFYKYLQQYKVTFIDENYNILSSQMVEYGTGATEPEYEKIPIKPQTNIYTYAFAGWDKQFSFITEDITVQTVYIGTLRKYSYIFYDEDGITVLKEYVGIYGDSIITPTDPCKDPEEQYVYTFIGWDKPVADTLIENVIYVAQYKTAVRQFVVTFLNGDGSVFQTMNIYYDETATTPSEIPTKASTAIHQYVFVSWDGDLENVKEDRTITPLFSEELRQYQVKFVTYDGSSKTVLVEYGSSGYGKVSTPLRPGYSFVSWSKDLTTITSDVITYAEFRSNSYDIIFYGEDSDSGSMDQLVVPYDSTVDLPTNTYTRKGYDFIGWRLSETDTTPAYLDGTSLLLDSEGLNLYATWQPIVYNITYDLDGGIAVNPSEYTIEDRIVLQDAIKEDYEFTGWYISSVEEVDTTKSTNTTSLLSLCSFSMFTTTSTTTTTTTSDEELEKVEIIEEGFVGNITLIARYEYAGYITLKDNSTLGMYYAEATVIEEIEVREDYSESTPVYLLGVLLNQTIGNLRNNFTNNDLIFLDSDNNELSDDDVVATGYQIVIYDDDNNIKDRVYIVLKGDINGDGKLNGLDYNGLLDHITSKKTVMKSELLATLINDDLLVNGLDYNMLLDHINMRVLIFDPTVTDTLIN